MRSVNDNSDVLGHADIARGSLRALAVFWIVSAVAIASIPLIELMLPRVSPKRFWHEDVYKVVYLLPIAVCWCVSIWIGDAAGVRQRIWSGLIQAAALVYLTYREFEADVTRTVLGVDSRSLTVLIVLWTSLLLVYTVAFGVITHQLRRNSCHRSVSGQPT